MFDDFVTCPKCAYIDPFLGDEKRLFQIGEVGIDRDGWFFIDFKAKCETCGFAYEFKNAWPTHNLIHAVRKEPVMP